MLDKIKTRESRGIVRRSSFIKARAALKLKGRRISGNQAPVFHFFHANFLIISALLAFPFLVHAAPNISTPILTPIPDTASANGTGSITPRVDGLLHPGPVLIYLTDGDCSTRSWITVTNTVAEALDEQNIQIGPYDKVTPDRAKAIVSGTNIVITRVRYEKQVEKSPLPFRVVFKMSSDVSPGSIAKGHTGAVGLVVKTFEATIINDRIESRRLLSKVIVRQPVNEETVGGIRTRMARALPSRGGLYQRLRCYTMTATGYSPYEGSGSGRCATGMRAGYGVVAVDPRVIRLGTKLYIEGYGYAIAGDTGGAIKGSRVDLGHTTYREANSVGRRRVKVWVLSGSS